MSFWEGVSDWFGLNDWDSAGNVFGNVGKIAAGGLAPFIKAWSDGPGGYTGSDAFRSGLSGPVLAGVGSAFNDSAIGQAIGGFDGVVSDLSQSLSSIEDLKALDSTLAGVLKGQSSSDLVNAIMQYMTSPGTEAEAQRAFNREEADRAVERARELRQTQYQDAVSSLKAAGLNPVLAAGGGIGGSSSSAPMATSSAAQGTRAVDIVQSVAMLLQALTGGISNIADAFGSHKTVVNKTYNNTNVRDLGKLIK